MAYGFD